MTINKFYVLICAAETGPQPGGPVFLADDERSLTTNFDEAACFTASSLARGIARREGWPDARILAEVED